jgi:hypothetical protein
MKTNNLHGSDSALYEMGKLAYVGGSAVYLGGYNDVMDPTGTFQVHLDNYSTGHCLMNFWGGTYRWAIQNGSTFEYDPFESDTGGYCAQSRPAGTCLPEKLAALIAPLTHQPGRDICSEAKEAAMLRRNTGTTEAKNPLPDRNGYILSSAYPNPFGKSTAIGFTLPRRERIRLSIYDAIGREVTVLADAEYPAGRSTVRFDASKLLSGMYFCRLQASGVVLSKKLMYVK